MYVESTKQFVEKLSELINKSSNAVGLKTSTLLDLFVNSGLFFTDYFVFSTYVIMSSVFFYTTETESRIQKGNVKKFRLH